MKESSELKQMEEARVLIGSRQFVEAEKVLRNLVAYNDQNTEAMYELANLFHQRGELKKAIHAFRKVLENDPNHTNASIGLSVIYNDVGHYDEAKKIFLQADRRIKSASLNRSYPGQSEGMLDGAMKNAVEEHKDRSRQASDGHISAKFAAKHYELGDLYLSYARYEEAIFEYQKASKLDPNKLEIQLKLAKAFAKKGMLAKAFETLRNLKTENPSYIPARLALGVLYYGQSKVLEAQSEWEQILAKDPANAEAKMYLNLSKTATETRLN